MDNLQCIDEYSVCNGNADCKDFSDESSNICLYYKCLEGTTKCADNLQCINSTNICDGLTHCSDGSDELCTASCLKSPLEAKSIVRQCSEQKTDCFPIERYCDGKFDCPAGSDEKDSNCSCENWNLVTCFVGRTALCLHKEWLEVTLGGFKI